jgi:hypothetical protein
VNANYMKYMTVMRDLSSLKKNLNVRYAKNVETFKQFRYSDNR